MKTAINLSTYLFDEWGEIGLLVQNVEDHHYSLLDLVFQTYSKSPIEEIRTAHFDLRYVLLKPKTVCYGDELCGTIESSHRINITIVPDGAIKKNHIGLIILNSNRDRIVKIVRFIPSLLDTIRLIPKFSGNDLLIKPMVQRSKFKELHYMDCVWLTQNMELIPRQNLCNQLHLKADYLSHLNWLVPNKITPTNDPQYAGPLIEVDNLKNYTGKVMFFGPFGGLLSQNYLGNNQSQYFAVLSKKWVTKIDERDSQMLFPEDLI